MAGSSDARICLKPCAVGADAAARGDGTGRAAGFSLYLSFRILDVLDGGVEMVCH
ncbi:hypothetical protein HBH70_192840 [Parastagonospora nodorum]|nr:hypothetical protein HBH51_176820 [Parastagonospora nodorum]KAH3993106.1 hypothetical protein HBI10_208260 [Parastagonospora nodorum]KAH4010818.1 hypothetical protein HBI13_203180 [Parastagonospora nodorum]KAH4019296.1 hypothetical protein HBI09_187560 [Parastagonospora nodorum]KAH4059907.1 hypothetical protein HBH49_025690 [Parastagonospora nodorum]